MDARRLSAHHRSSEGNHQSRRREDHPARSRRGADGPPGRAAGRHLRHAARQARRRGRRSRRAARGTARPTRRRLRAFAADRLADFKVPRRIVILDEIPKGATGKLQRIGLAAKLGLGHDARSASSAPVRSAAISARGWRWRGPSRRSSRAARTSPPCSANGLTLIEADRRATVAVNAHRDPADTRSAGLRDHHTEGAFGAGVVLEHCNRCSAPTPLS